MVVIKNNEKKIFSKEVKDKKYDFVPKIKEKEKIEIYKEGKIVKYV